MAGKGMGVHGSDWSGLTLSAPTGFARSSGNLPRKAAVEGRDVGQPYNVGLARRRFRQPVLPGVEQRCNPDSGHHSPTGLRQQAACPKAGASSRTPDSLLAGLSLSR